MKRMILLPLAAFLLAACSDLQQPTEPLEPEPSFEISDAVHSSGNPHFFFLPPMVPNPSADFTEKPFDGSLEVEVNICIWNLDAGGCGSSLEIYNMVSGPGSETVRVSAEDEHYIVNWHTDGILDRPELSLGENEVYRIRVMVGQEELGHADVEVAGSNKELKNVDTNEFIPLLDGKTLPIKFRIEEGALDYGGLGISAGKGHTCSLTSDGTAYCWGHGTYGQRGDGSTTRERTTPVAVSFNGQFSSLTTGEWHTCGLTPDGTAYCWGQGINGQRGDGTTTLTWATPVAVSFNGQFASLIAGDYHTCGLTLDGTAYCWGNGWYGQRGDGTTNENRTTPVAVSFTGQFASLTAGGTHTCGLTPDGTAYCWGYGGYGQLGYGGYVYKRTTPVAVSFTGQFASLTAGHRHTCGVTPDGTAYCWGLGRDGQRGDGTTWWNRATPVAVHFTGQFASLTAGGGHTCGLTPDGTAYCWGNGYRGQLGDGTWTHPQTTPVAVSFTGQFASLTAGYYHTCGLTPDGTAYCWGCGSSGQLGNGSRIWTGAPVMVLGLPPG